MHVYVSEGRVCRSASVKYVYVCMCVCVYVLCVCVYVLEGRVCSMWGRRAYTYIKSVYVCMCLVCMGTFREKVFAACGADVLIHI